MLKKVNKINNETNFLMDSSRRIGQINMVPVEMLELNKMNYFASADTPESIESLADEIRDTGGIKQPLVAYKSGEKYTLISGERRTKATLLNIERYPETAQRTVPVEIIEKPGDDIEERNLLNIYNETRKPTNSMVLWQTYNLVIQWRDLKERNLHPKGNGAKRKYFANKLQLGEKKSDLLYSLVEKEIIPLLLEKYPDRSYKEYSYDEFLEATKEVKEKQNKNSDTDESEQRKKEEEENNDDMKEYLKKLGKYASNVLDRKISINDKKISISYEYDPDLRDLKNLWGLLGLGHMPDAITLEEGSSWTL